MSTETTAFTQETTSNKTRNGMPWGYALAFAGIFGALPFGAHFGYLWTLLLFVASCAFLWIGSKKSPSNINFWGGQASQPNGWVTVALVGGYGLGTSLGILTPDFSLATTVVISVVYALLMLFAVRTLVPWQDSKTH